ncbi:hypothetical protein HPP92_007936 [Vanilla planifolia]|uniref:Transmembrane protein 234 homolog n=1 Tax=Vanilla planifolia TaxID=51239 RepID=A0A835RRW0_VANPL|nr:hypothetical protein HPP92_007936 [Vanilla planifolia]
MIGDVEKMIVVGLVWGTTNSLMRRGAVLWDQKLRSAPQPPSGRWRIVALVCRWIELLLSWQYSVPFIINLMASAAFFYILSDSPISVAVPVTNATTFAATAMSAMLLGEEMKVGRAFLGTFLIVLGVYVCIN